MSSWRGYQGGVTAARAGHDVASAPSSRCTWTTVRPRARTSRYRSDMSAPWRTSTASNPFPPGSPRAGRHVLGTQANVWTEVMEDPARVDYQTFPRLAAFAEVAWSALPAPAERDFADFERRMAAHYGQLDALGVACRRPGHRGSGAQVCDPRMETYPTC